MFVYIHFQFTAKRKIKGKAMSEGKGVSRKFRAFSSECLEQQDFLGDVSRQFGRVKISCFETIQQIAFNIEKNISIF